MLNGRNSNIVQSARAKLKAYNSDDFDRTCGSKPTTIMTTKLAHTPIMKMPVKK